MPSALGPPHGHQYLTGWPWGDGGPGPDRQGGGIQSKGPTHKEKAGTEPCFSFWDTRCPSVFPLKGPDAAIDRPGPTFHGLELPTQLVALLVVVEFQEWFWL